MALPFVQAVGAANSGTGNVVVTLPTHAANDILVLVTETNGGENVAAVTGGWAKAPSPAPRASGSSTIDFQWLRAAGAGTTNPTLLDPGNHILAYALVIRGCITTGNPFEMLGAGSTGTGTALTIVGGTTTYYDELVICMYGATTGDGSAEFSAQANAALASVTEQGDYSTGSGSGGSVGAFSGTKATPGAVGNSTITLRQSGAWEGIVVAFIAETVAMTSMVGTITPPAAAGIVRYAGLSARPRAGLVGWSNRATAGNSPDFHQGVGIFGDSDLTKQACVWNRVSDGYTGSESRRIHREGKIIEQRGITALSAIRFQAQVLATHPDGLTIQWNVVTDQPIVIYEFWPVDEATVIRIDSPDRDVTPAPVETTYSSVLSFTPNAMISITLGEQQPPEGSGTAFDGTDDAAKLQVGYGFADAQLNQGAIAASVDAGANPITNGRCQTGVFISAGDDSTPSSATIEGTLTQIGTTLKINWTFLANSVRPVWLLAMRGGTFRVASDTEATTNTTKQTTGLAITPEQALFLSTHRTSSGADAVQANLGIGVLNASSQASIVGAFDEGTPDIADSALSTTVGITFLEPGTPTTVGSGDHSAFGAGTWTASWANTDGTARFWMGLFFTTTVTTFHQAAAVLAGAATVAAAVSLRLGGAAALATSATLAPNARNRYQPTATLAGTGALAATGGIRIQAAAALAGQSTLAALGGLHHNAAAALAGSGALSATAIVKIGGAAALTASGSISPTPWVRYSAASVLSGGGSLSAAGRNRYSVAASLSASAVITALGGHHHSVAAALNAVAVLTAAAIVRRIPVGAPTLWVVIYNSSGNHVGELPRIMAGTRILESINQIGLTTVAVAAADPSGSQASINAEVGLWREGEGEIFRGRVAKRQMSVSQQGDALLLLTLKSLGVEVAQSNTYFGFAVEESAVSSALTALLAGTGWTGTVTGSGYQDVTKQWDSEYIYPAVAELAKIAQAYVRETTTHRELEIKNVSSDSGIRLMRVDEASPSAAVGLISAIRSFTEDGDTIANRIVPFGKTDSDSIFDLRDSDRVSPYTIQSLNIRAPNINPSLIGDPLTFETSSTTIGKLEGADTFFGNNLELTAEGLSRCLFLMCASDDTSAPDDWGRPTANGRPMVQFHDSVVGSWRFVAWYLQAPDEGINRFDITAPIIPTTTDKEVFWHAVAVDGVRQRGNPVGNVATNSGSSTTASVTITSTALQKAMAFFVGDDNLDAATVPSGQTKLGVRAIPLDGQESISSYKDGAAPTVTQTWGLSPSAAWVALGFNIRPQPTYFLEDAPSVTAYGRRVKMLPLGTFKPTSPLLTVQAANSLYDAGVDYLLKHKDPQKFYEIEVAYLPGTPLAWLVGDSMRVVWRGYSDDGIWLDIDEDLIVVEREQTFDETGSRHWSLKLSTVSQLRLDGYEKIADLMQRVEAIQMNQV